MEQDEVILSGVFCWTKNLFSMFNIFQVQIMKIYVWMLYKLPCYNGGNQTLTLKTGTTTGKIWRQMCSKDSRWLQIPKQHSDLVWSVGVSLKYLENWGSVLSPYLAWFISCKSYNSVELRVLNQSVYLTPRGCVGKDGRHALWKTEIIEYHQIFRKTLYMGATALDCMQLFFHFAVFQIIE